MGPIRDPRGLRKGPNSTKTALYDLLGHFYCYFFWYFSRDDFHIFPYLSKHISPGMIPIWKDPSKLNGSRATWWFPHEIRNIFQPTVKQPNRKIRQNIRPQYQRHFFLNCFPSHRSISRLLCRFCTVISRFLIAETEIPSPYIVLFIEPSPRPYQTVMLSNRDLG